MEQEDLTHQVVLLMIEEIMEVALYLVQVHQIQLQLLVVVEVVHLMETGQVTLEDLVVEVDLMGHQTVQVVEEIVLL